METEPKRVNYNIEAEQVLLGGLMGDNENYYKVYFLEADDFYEPVHQRLYAAISQRVSEGKKANPTLLGPQFQSDPSLVDMGGAAYLVRLTGLGAGIIHLKDYANTILEHSRMRKIDKFIKEYSESTEGNSKDITEKLISQLLQTQGLDDGGKASSLFKISTDEVEKFTQKLPCYSTGIEPIDYSMQGGFYSKKTYCFAARPKNGKTMLMGTLFDNMSRNGVRLVYVACEMGAAEIQQRALARAIGVNAIAFIKDRDDKRFREKIAKAAFETPKDSYFIDAPGITFDALKAKLYNYVRMKGIQGVFVDYLQLIKGRQRQQSEAEFQAEVAQWLAEFAKRENIFVCYAAQINREGSVRGSDGIIMAADQVYHLHLDREKETAWMDILVTRYTQFLPVGTEQEHALRLHMHGPHFMDARNHTTDNKPVYSMMETKH